MNPYQPQQPQQTSNTGSGQRHDPPAYPPYGGQPSRATQLGAIVDPSAERVLSAAAHAAIAFGLLGVGFLISLAISGVIWLYSRRSPYVRFHAEQAGCYQCSVFLINAVFVIAIGASSGVSLFRWLHGESDFGLGWGSALALVLFVLWFLGTIIYGVIAALMVLAGKPFKYPVIGNRIKYDA